MNITKKAEVIRRHSLLKRNAAHSREHFSQYYEHQHGPLAAGTAGFRKFSKRYIQNHVETMPDGSEPPFDGVTMTTQVPRPDYTRGFFNEPDYVNVQPDEVYLFDLSKTISVLGHEELELDGPPTAWKALILTHESALGAVPRKGLSRLVVNHLDPSTATALGFGAGSFEFDVLCEAWYESAQARIVAVSADRGSASGSKAMFLPVREVLIFGPEKPWEGAAA